MLKMKRVVLSGMAVVIVLTGISYHFIDSEGSQLEHLLLMFGASAFFVASMLFFEWLSDRDFERRRRKRRKSLKEAFEKSKDN